MSAYSEAKKWIESITVEDADRLYDGVRDILSKDMEHYPSDHQIKELQRLADAKYEDLLTEKKKREEELEAEYEAMENDARGFEL